MDAIVDRQNGHGDMVRSLIRSHYRWVERLFLYGMMGNGDRRILVGVDSLLLAIFIAIHPTSTHEEQAALIFNEGGVIYLDSQIAHHLKEMDVTKKVSSTEVYQAFTQINMLKAELFWSGQYPLGVVGTERQKFIDVDEFGMNLSQCNNKYGYSLSPSIE